MAAVYVALRLKKAGEDREAALSLRALEITALDRRFQTVPTLSEALRSVVELEAAA